MKSLHARKFFEYGLVALVAIAMLISQTGCSPENVKISVETFGSFFISPDGTRIIGFGAAPTGQEIIGTITQNGTSVGTASPEETVTVTTAIAREGWRYISWASIPAAMQTAILVQVEEIVNAAAIMEVPIPVFMLDPSFIQINGCSVTDGVDCSKQS